MAASVKPRTKFKPERIPIDPYPWEKCEPHQPRKLTWTKFQQAYQLYATRPDLTLDEIAAMFGVSKSTFCKFKRRYEKWVKATQPHPLIK